MINQSSFNFSVRLNKKSVLIPAFIPPNEIQKIDSQIEQKINNLTKRTDYTFCTNAYDVSYDKNGEETYKIIELVNLFCKKEFQNLSLIISDPSGNYKKTMDTKGLLLTNNILIINYPHDFNAILSISHCLIRYTTTDGDSISVKEALTLKKNVIASNIVERPSGVQLTSLNTNELESLILNYYPSIPESSIVNGFIQIFELYKEMSRS